MLSQPSKFNKSLHFDWMTTLKGILLETAEFLCIQMVLDKWVTSILAKS